MVTLMAKKLNIRPTSGVYATYKRLSYQPWTAIAEFVDNSTQSFFDHKNELMSQKYAKGLRITIDYIEDKDNGDSIEIYDDAYGMEWPDFQRAVVLDRPPQKTTGRNEFGMGLKTAACWFGSIWSVESTQLGSRNISEIQFLQNGYSLRRFRLLLRALIFIKRRTTLLRQ